MMLKVLLDWTQFMENIEIDNPEMFEQLDNIIMGDGELADRIYTLNEMNSEKISIADFDEYPVICLISGIILLFCMALGDIFYIISNFFTAISNIFYYLFLLIYIPILVVNIISGMIFVILCIDWDWYPY